MAHDPERLRNLADMRRAETAGGLMPFPQVVNWLRTSLRRLAEVVGPLQRLLEEYMASAPCRTKNIVSSRAIN